MPASWRGPWAECPGREPRQPPREPPGGPALPARGRPLRCPEEESSCRGSSRRRCSRSCCWCWCCSPRCRCCWPRCGLRPRGCRPFGPRRSPASPGGARGAFPRRAEQVRPKLVSFPVLGSSPPRPSPRGAPLGRLAWHAGEGGAPLAAAGAPPSLAGAKPRLGSSSSRRGLPSGAVPSAGGWSPAPRGSPQPEGPVAAEGPGGGCAPWGLAAVEPAAPPPRGGSGRLGPRAVAKFSFGNLRAPPRRRSVFAGR